MPAWHPSAHPLSPFSTAHLPPQGHLLVNLDSIQTTVLGVGVGGGGRAYCCKQGEGAAAGASPLPLESPPCVLPREERGGGAAHASICSRGGLVVSPGEPRGGHQGSEKGTRGQGVLSTTFDGPPVWYQTLPKPQGRCPWAWPTRDAERGGRREGHRCMVQTPLPAAGGGSRPLGEASLGEARVSLFGPPPPHPPMKGGSRATRPRVS